MTYFNLILFTFACIVINVKGICDSQTGPVGSIECSANPNFDKKQWTTCLTNNYIQRQSQGRIQCADSNDNYCTYPCMPEVYYLNNGNVVDTCACNDSLVPPTSSLPTECMSPDGSNCDWYKNCLERKYSCQGTSAEYLFVYTTTFCNLFIKYKDIFTDRAQRWIDNGRKCLQVALVPFIRPFINGTCQEIHTAGVDTFKPCNIKPYPGDGSICDMTRRDWIRAFWMMKSEYSVSTSTAAYVWLQDALDTFYECQNDPEVNDFRHIYQEFKLTIDLIQTSWNNQINLNKNQFDQIAVDIAHRIAKFLMAPPSRWGWYAYGIPLSTQRSTTAYPQITIALLVADLPEIINDTLIPPVNTTNIEFDELIQQLKNALTNGNLKIQNDNGTFYVSQMSYCLDMKCHATTENIFAPPYGPNNDSSTNFSSMMSLLLLTLTFFIHLY
jgi:hypothetical protein